MKIMKTKFKAFSFLESIISVFILSFGIVAVLPLLTTSLNESHDSRDQIIAAFLAQEGIELVYNIRDNNWLDTGNDKAFDGHDNLPPQVRDNCRIQFDSTKLEDCNNGNETKKLYLSNSNFYTHIASPNSTKFQRKIAIDYIDSAGASGADRDDAAMAKVTSTVVWGRDDFPDPLDPDLSKRDCNTKNKCSEVTVTLTTWH